MAFRPTAVLAARITLAAALVAAGSASPQASGPSGPQFLLTWGQKGDKPGEFFSPISIAIDQRDRIFVSDLNNSRVQQFTTAGRYVGEFDLPRDTPARKSCIAGGMTVDAAGLIYVSFMNQNKVAVYTQTGKLVREWGKQGSGDGDLHGPGGIVVARDGTVYVADERNHRIQRFTAEGKFLEKWGEYGSAPGEFGAPEPKGSRFAGPNFLAMDDKGRFYTTEGVPTRVQQFSPQGKPLLAWGDKSSDPGGFGAYPTGYSKQTFGPIGVAVDKQDRVWVSSLNDRVQAFTTGGRFLMGLGGSGKEPGRFARPHGMAFDSKACLYVADAGNERIQKFALTDR